MDDDTESRKAFEKWMNTKGWHLFPRWPKKDWIGEKNKAGNYIHDSTQLAWEAWCEAIKYWDEQINEFSDQPPCSKAKP